jgi:hypothetical protein
MTRASKNSSLRPRQNDAASYLVVLLPVQTRSKKFACASPFGKWADGFPPKGVLRVLAANDYHARDEHPRGFLDRMGD